MEHLVGGMGEWKMDVEIWLLVDGLDVHSSAKA